MNSQSVYRKNYLCRKLPYFVFLFVLIFAAAALIFVLIFPTKKAAADSNASYQRRIVSVKVNKDDSLWKIASRYCCNEKESIPQKVDEIKEINHLEEDTIYPDTYLIVQYMVQTN